MMRSPIGPNGKIGLRFFSHFNPSILIFGLLYTMKPIQTILFFFLLSGWCNNAKSQDTDTPQHLYMNSIQVDFGGHARVYSINYERILQTYQLHFTNTRFGVAFIPRQRSADILRIPLSFNFNFANIDGHHFEGGLGQMAEIPLIENSTTRLWTIFNVGYRYRPVDATINFRLTYTPLWDLFRLDNTNFLTLDGDEYVHMGGVSIGWNF